MLDIDFIRNNSEAVKANCLKRRVTVPVDALIAKDIERRAILQEIEAKRAERKKGSKQKPDEATMATLRQLGEDIAALEISYTTIEEQCAELLLQIPNMTHPNSPVGGEDEFVVVSEQGVIPQFSFTPKDHEELLLALDCLDFERATKVAGAKFYYTKGDLVRLNQALLNYGIDVVEKHGFVLMETPDLALKEVLTGTGYNPRGEAKDQIYVIEDSELSLIATAEITVGGYHANEILDLSTGPKKYLAISHCFRKEAGAYGRTSKGLYRVHQFTKLEMFVLCRPEDSETLHAELLAIEQEICSGLGLAYRVIDIPTGDLGGPAYRKYDLEAWMTMKGDPANDKMGDYGEVTSTSNCTDYQARRLHIRYRKEDGTTEFVHTLNGTAIVLSRFPIAITEQYQNEDGTITIPEALQSYMGKKVITPRS